MEYKVIGKTCDCSGEPIDLILRTITETEISEYKKNNINLNRDQAIMVCPKCNRTVIHWLFLKRNLRTAVWALNERYYLEPINKD